MKWGWTSSVLALGSSKLLGMLEKALTRQLKTQAWKSRESSELEL